MSYQVAVLYDGKKLIPGPRVRFTRDIQRSEDGTARRRGWKITVTGEVAAFSGSPRNDGTWWTGAGYPPAEDAGSNAPERRVANLRNKLRAITDLFDREGRWFEVVPGDGTSPIKALLRTAQVTYQEGQWFNTVPFTVEAEADCVFFGAYEAGADSCRLGQGENPPEETWAVEQADEVGRSYRLTHTVAATGRKRFADDGTGAVAAPAWKVARALVLGPDDPDDPGLAGDGAASLLGFDTPFLAAAGVLDLDTFLPFNYTRSQQADEAQGRFSVTETWLCVDPSAPQPSGQSAGRCLEELTTESRYAVDSGLFTVSVNGTITGLEERDPRTRALVRDRYANAAARFAPVLASNAVTHAIAEDQGGRPLNPAPVSSTVTRNKVSGVIQYSVTFDNRPAATDPTYLSEAYSVSVDHAADVFAEIGVVNRPAGPVLQPIGSRTRMSVSVSADIAVPVAYGLPLPDPPVYDPLAAALLAVGVPAQIFVASDRETWSQRTGRYSRQTTYVYQ